VVKALNTVDLDYAKRMAWDWWISSGDAIAPKSQRGPMAFEKIAIAYLQHLNGRVLQTDFRLAPSSSAKKNARHEQSIRLHLTPFFGNMRIEEIRPADTERWLEWRTDTKLLRSRVIARGQKHRLNLPTRSTIQKTLWHSERS
jgi:hypothetical protein